MDKRIFKILSITGMLFLMSVQQAFAGPPFNTDDPQPVDLNHWEYYISSINSFRNDVSSGTSPHIEVNYGLVRNVQVHLIVPLNYMYSRVNGFKVGYAYTELGVKYRFIQESENVPQIGTFPILEIPTIRNIQFGNGLTQLFIPLWTQKSLGKFTTYCGAGYWINPGVYNQNWLFTGWEGQYDFSKVITLGGEIYYHTADVVGDNPALGFNVGGSINFTERFHVIFSAGHSLINEPVTTSYLGLLWTI